MEVLFRGKFGLERETLRIDERGRLAGTPHPFENDEHITRDFCENQIEIITPVCSSIDEALDEMKKFDDIVSAELSKKGERLWIYSNPPYIESEDEIPIAGFTGEFSSKRNYRVQLERKYGKRLMLLSGVHYNFSFDDEWLRDRFSGEPIRDINDMIDKQVSVRSAEECGKPSDHQAYINKLYLKLYKQLMYHSWLLVLLSAASPYYDMSFDKDGQSGVILSKYSSIRNSERGYWNHFIPILDHSSFSAFCDSINVYIEKGMLSTISELYLPVRLKPRGMNSLENLVKNGVDHIELRMFDLDPGAPLGIDADMLKFAHLFILYLLELPDFDFDEKQQNEALQKYRNAALLDTEEDMINKAEELLLKMKRHFYDSQEAGRIISDQVKKLHTGREKRYINYYDNVKRT